MCTLTRSHTLSLFPTQRQRLIRSPNSQLDGDASPTAGGTPLKGLGSGGLENGGSVERQTPEGAGLGDAGEKPGAEGCQAEEEEEDDDGPFRPLHWPGEDVFFVAMCLTEVGI